MFPPPDGHAGPPTEPTPDEWRSDADGVVGACTSGMAGAPSALPGALDDPAPGDTTREDAAAALRAMVEIGGLGDLEGVVAGLSTGDPVSLSDGELAAQLAALPALVARLEAVMAERLGLFDARRAYAGSGHRNGASWWAAHSVLPKEVAASTLRLARGLRSSAIVAEAFAHGEISAHAARLLADYATRNPALFAPQAATFVEVAKVLSARELRQLLEIWADIAAPSQSAKKEAKRWASRRFEHRTGPDGRLHASFALDIPEALLCGEVFRHFEELVRIDDESPDDRDGGQRRADAFAAMLHALRDELPHRAQPCDHEADGPDGSDRADGAAEPDHGSSTGGSSTRSSATGGGATGNDTSGGTHADRSATKPKTRPGRRADVSVVIPWELLGGESTGLAHIGGLPLAITGDLARHLTCDHAISGMLFHGHEPLTAGRATHTFPDRIRKAIMRRDGGCAFPGCGMTPRFCDAHHIWHWDDGGPTDADNGVALCQYHHRLMHHGRWKVWIDPCTQAPRFRRLDPGERPHRHAHQRHACCDASTPVEPCGHRAWKPNRTHHLLIEAANSFTRRARPPDHPLDHPLDHPPGGASRE